VISAGAESGEARGRQTAVRLRHRSITGMMVPPLFIEPRRVLPHGSPCVAAFPFASDVAENC